MLRRTPAASAQVHIKSVLFRTRLAFTQVPFPHMPRLVAPMLLQRPRQRNLLHWQHMEVRHIAQLPHRMPADILRHPHRRRILPRQDARPRRRAHRRSRVSIRKTHPLRRQPVQVRRLIERAPVAPQIPPPQIIQQNKNHIGPLRHRDSHPPTPPEKNKARFKVAHASGLPSKALKLKACSPIPSPLPPSS